jgi:secondary thiamine-phosphate synthase enzyme
MKTVANIAVDGASKGNPGPAGIGVVISDESGKVIKEISENIGKQTNNFAEYTALIRALSEARELGFTHLHIQTDSELMARQMNGEYRVKNDGIIPLYNSAKMLMGKFQSVTLLHVLRGRNAAADKLASAAALCPNGKIEEPAPVQTSMLMEAPVVKKESVAPSMEKKMIHKIPVRTSSRSQFVDITREVQDIVKSSGVRDGVCTVFVPHTTAGVTINENADPDVVRDILDTLNRLVPESSHFRHSEGNSDSHIKASMMGFSVTVFVENGRLALGTWQGIYFCEFDGPRSRHVFVRVSS